MAMVAAYIVVLSDRDAIAWVIAEQRMAFPPHRLRQVQRLQPGDCLFLYATRAAFHNPTRDRGRVFGEAEVTTAVTLLDQPVELAGRAFNSGCDLKVQMLAPMRQGIELAPLVPQLSVFPDVRSWAVRLRRPLVPIGPDDAKILRSALKQAAGQPADVLATYAI